MQSTIRKITLFTAILAAVLLVPRDTFAAHEVEHCVQVYGGGVVCGIQAPEHKPVEADLGDINPALIGGGLLLASGILLYLSRRVKARTSGIDN